MGEHGIHIAGIRAGATGKNNETITSAQGAGYWRFLQKGGETNNKITGKMAVNRRSAAWKTGSSHKSKKRIIDYSKP